MFEIHRAEAPQATARDLAAYHTRRERFYEAAARLLATDATGIDVRCPDEHAEPRHAAFEQAALPTSDDLASELRALAQMSRRTAQSIEQGDIAEAAALCDGQARFLRLHAGSCIRQLAAQLLARGTATQVELGRALVKQIDEDMLLLAH